MVIVFHSAHGIRVKLVSNWGQSMLYTKSLKVLHRKGKSMLTGLKVSSFTCKCIFYTPELNAKAMDPMKLNLGSLEMKHTNG